MQIKDLQPRQGKVELVAKVVEKGESRNIATANFSGKVCDAKLQDDSGAIKFTLWNDQVEQVGVGDTVKVTNGYVSEYRGEIQLSTGKFGKLEVVSKGESVAVKKNFDDQQSSEDDIGDAEDDFDEEEFVE